IEAIAEFESVLTEAEPAPAEAAPPEPAAPVEIPSESAAPVEIPSQSAAPVEVLVEREAPRQLVARTAPADPPGDEPGPAEETAPIAEPWQSEDTSDREEPIAAAAEEVDRWMEPDEGTTVLDLSDEISSLEEEDDVDELEAI